MINQLRMKEIAEKAIDILVECDPETAADLVFDDLDMNEEEINYFNVEALKECR